MTNASGGNPPVETGVDARMLLTAEERAKMISRIHSLVYWVGMLIPERELLGESEIDLREVVYNITNKEKLSPDEIAQVNELIRLLKDKERELEKKLEKDPITRDAAKEMLEEVCGLLRAIDELRSVETIEKAEFRKQEMLSRIEDAKRWQKFVESIKTTG
jgi:SMC interacting uncharacterized protein involved in chromosome segregation